MGNELFLISTFFFALMAERVIKSENASGGSSSSHITRNVNICADENKTSYINGIVQGRLSTPPHSSHEKFCHHDFEFPPSLNFVFDFEEIFLRTESGDRGRGHRGCNDQDHVHIVSHNGTYQSLGFYCATRKDWDRCVQVPPGSSWVQIQFYAKNKSLAADPIEARSAFSSSSSFKLSFKVANESVCPSPFILTDLLVWGGAAGGLLFCFLILPLAFLCCKKRRTNDAKKPLEYLSSRPLDSSVLESHLHQLDFQGRRAADVVVPTFPNASTNPDDDDDASSATPFPHHRNGIVIPVTPPTSDAPLTPEAAAAAAAASPLSLPVRVHPTPSGRRQIIQSELTDDSDLPVFFTNLAALKSDKQQPNQKQRQKRQKERHSRGGDKEISLSTFGSGRQKAEGRRSKSSVSADGIEYASTTTTNGEYADPGSFKRNTYEEARRSFLFHKAPAPPTPGVYTLPTSTTPTKTENLRQLSIKESPSEYIARRPDDEYNSPWDDTRDNLDSIMPDLVPTQGSVKWHSVAPGSMSDLVTNAEDKKATRKADSPDERNSLDKKLELKKKSKGKEGEAEEEEEEDRKKAKKKKKKKEKDEKRKGKQKEEQKSDGKLESSNDKKTAGTDRRTSSIAAEPTLEFKSIAENIFMKQNAIKK